MGPGDLRSLLLDAAERSLRYLESLDDRGVAARPEAVDRLLRALDGPQPEQPVPPGAILGFLDEHGSPATVASAGGRYFGFVTGGALPATLAANWLAGAWDQNSFSFISSPAASLFEETALRWIRAAVGLPESAAGALVTGATMANFTCLAAARHRVLSHAGWDVEERGLTGAPKITLIVGAEVHATLFKVFGLLGLGRADVIRVPVDDQGRMRGDASSAASRPSSRRWPRPGTRIKRPATTCRLPFARAFLRPKKPAAPSPGIPLRAPRSLLQGEYAHGESHELSSG